mgnify:FL=1|tara:strand:+ start:420 stop:875 length:456 start_codon:yes stop_codon:yes gene_type:complete
MHFRPMQSDDLDAVAGIESLVSPVPWPQTQFIDSIKNHHAKVLEYSSGVFGYAIYSVQLDQAELLNLAIEPQSQGSGWGRRLLRLVLEGLPPEVEKLFLDVRVSNFRAIRLYHSFRFEQIGEREGYYGTSNGVVRENALVMCCDVSYFKPI